MQKAIRIFKRKLTNLSSANPYLWMRRLKSDFFLDITEIESVTTVPSWEIIDQTLRLKKSVQLCPIADSRDSEISTLTRKISGLLKKQKLQMEERGVNDLHLAFPFVLGKWPDGSWVRTPFLLIPVEISITQKSWNLVPNVDEAFLNPAFLLAYAFHFSQPLEQQFFDKELNLNAEDGISFLTELYEKLKTSNLEIHFNQALFSSQIQPFQFYNKEDLPTGFQPGMLKLQPEAVVGLFPQSDSILIPDFEYLENHGVDLEDVFLKKIESNQSVTEKNMYCPLPMDGSQEACIRHIKKGYSLVVQGPPGTGKSQLIANLMADAMGSGKSVLLVCQKKVALEVVQQRISEIGLGDFIGLWADFKNDKSEIFNQLSAQIEHLEESEIRNRKLDTVVLERNFALVCQTIDRISQKVENWKESLYQIDSAGISIWELYRSKKKETTFSSELLTEFKLSEWLEFKNWLSEFYEPIFLTRSPEFEFAARSNWFSLLGDSIVSLPLKLLEIAKIYKRLSTEIEDLGLNFKENRENDLERISLIFEEILELYSKVLYSDAAFLLKISPGEWKSPSFWKKQKTGLDELKKLNDQLKEWPNNFEFSVQEVSEVLAIVEKKHTFFFKPLVFNVFRLFDIKFKQIHETLSAFGFKSIEINKLRSTLELAINWINLQNQVLFAGNQIISNEKIGKTSQILETVIGLSPEIEKLSANALKISEFYDSEFDWEFLCDLAQKTISCQQLNEKIKKEWVSFFPEEESLPIIPHGIEKRLVLIENQLDKIIIADRAMANRQDHWTRLTLEIVHFFSPRNISKAALFKEIEDAWKIHWIHRIETELPILKEPGTAFWEEELDLLRKKIQEKNELVIQILQLKLKERTYKNLEYNRLGNRLTYRELSHQVNKKRQRFPMRQLWKLHGQEIQKLIPAWLATPESVSATWPMESQFDLVIFDEASQCFAEKGIASAFRGMQLVVVGDDKQLPPHQLFSARWEEDSEEEALFSEQDSLLDLAKQFLPQKMLTNHYRSEYPELISFSNQFFYQDKLEVIPLSKTLLARKPAINYLKTEGNWHLQKNEPEAIFLVDRILDFISKNPVETVGIISFNSRQQMFIEALIEKEAKDRNVKIPESLFVKNIENVQGDERDHIWFSIGYAQTETGKVVSQYGSLSIPGGENRLNVAISRARKSIVVVASILPTELPVSQDAPLGPRLLKKFLEYTYELSQTNEIQAFNNLNSDLKLEFENQFSFSVADGESVSVPFADFGLLRRDKSIDLFFLDGDRVFGSQSMKDHFGLKYIAFSSKNFNLKYLYSGHSPSKKDDPGKLA